MKVIALHELKDRPDFNPRDNAEKAQIDTLAKSIAARGLLQPLVVSENDSGYYLVDGHRRVCALRQLGIGEAPVVIREATDEVEQLIDAVTANVQRADLSIVEEARAFARMRAQGKPVKQIASELGVSQKLVSSRLAMLTLPAYVLKLIGDEGLQPGHIPTLVEMARVSPDLATGVATVVVERKVNPARFMARPFEQIAQGHSPELGVWVVGAERPTVTIASVRPDLSEIDTARLKELGELNGTDIPNAVTVDVAAAVAFGCVYTPPATDEPWGAKLAICDRSWVVSAVSNSLAELVKKARKAHKATAAVEGHAPEAGEPVSEEQVKEAKREERQAELKARLVHNAVNLNLGAELFTALDALKLDRDMALLLARMVIRDDARDLFLSGMRFCAPEFVKETPAKSGPVKVEYELPDRDAQAQKVWEFIERGEDGEQVLGRLMQVLGMAGLCDQRTVAVSSRPGRPNIAARHDNAIADLVGARLPVPIRERLDEQAKVDAEYAKQQLERQAANAAALEQDDDEYLEREHEANFPQDDED